ncbi:ABC transporter permease subunit [Mesobacillus selenatarsenatis]|uniref:ABC transporter, permease protein n=1 Tax=Mesobacillus selenatarsenatis (strain DSM 18680 / JCM 14380 / FERM P-15431 / SF-1) TaxID=1321606 RepID=A0A0A8X6L8_MESS1|nr:ABC transporter permease subunit [Mesobacillus selenatarsenatis]GAM15620.1 ABC transporter, permease protein [Mesobacillus selenatarsenatis SF-1]
MNLFKREMKANRKSLIIWSIGVVFMVAAGMGKYSSLEGTGQSMNALMADMPKSLQAIMGTGSLDLSTPIGYFGVLFLYLAVMAAIHAAMLGSNIIAKEERDKTVEFLLVKPVSRTRMITSKLIAALVNILIFNAVTFASSVGMVRKYAEGEDVTGDITLLMIGMFILQLIFLVIGTAIAAIYKNAKKATSLATGILLFLFILSIAIDLNEKLDGLKFLTPFKYYDAKLVLEEGGFEPLYLTLSALLLLGLTIVTYVFYRKRDMNV